MKIYKKPSIEIYTLSGNETICGGCDVKIRDDATLGNQLDFLGGNMDGKLTKDEAELIFGTNESCVNEVEDYCKFLGTVSNLSWS